MQKSTAIKYRCPSQQTLVLTGATHTVTIEVDTDVRLEAAVAAWCTAAPEYVAPLRPGDVLLQDAADDDGFVILPRLSGANCTMVWPL